MPNVRELLEREGATVDLEDGHFERLLRRRERRQRNRRLGAGLAALVVILLTAAILLRSFASEPVPADTTEPSPTEHVTDKTGQRAPIEGLEFPMVAGPQPSTPITGDSVVEFRSWALNGPSSPGDMAIYADGRVVWHPIGDDAGYFQLRLTPAGIDTIKSMIISTGLFNHDLQIVRPSSLARLTIVRGGRSVYVQWATNDSWLAGRNNPSATPSESRDLGEIERLLDDPSAWQLSADMYADPTIRPFVPSGFMFEYDRDGPDLSKLPSFVRELLVRYDPGSTDCSVITTEAARSIAEALARAGYAPTTNDPSYLDWRLPGESGGPSNPHLNPVLPHELNCNFSE